MCKVLIAGQRVLNLGPNDGRYPETYSTKVAPTVSKVKYEFGLQVT
jgi:hypothetical protein